MAKNDGRLIRHVLRSQGTYQITLPKQACELLGIMHDTAMLITTDGKRLILTPTKDEGEGDDYNAGSKSNNKRRSPA